jgi:hypothetical protein
MTPHYLARVLGAIFVSAMIAACGSTGTHTQDPASNLQDVEIPEVNCQYDAKAIQPVRVSIHVNGTLPQYQYCGLTICSNLSGQNVVCVYDSFNTSTIKDFANISLASGQYEAKVAIYESAVTP